ncbi:MAG TPA: hypothetical protein VD926_07680 [Acidimicrobiales bacterium]|nr:hypothetical protein [Acidimicrobiales bacterium]
MIQATDGRRRTVYDLGAFVLKVDKPAFRGSCRREAARWEQAVREGWADLLCPVLLSGETWLVMPKATIADWATDPNLPALRVALWARDIVDTGKGNAGYLGGQLVAVDYES